MRLRPVEWVTAVLLSGFALVLHALRWSSAGPLWRDEVAAANLATSSGLAEVVTQHAREAFPPPFFFLLRGWIFAVGGTDASLRAFGLLVGVASLLALWWAARRTASTVPLIALALVAIHPTVLIYGDALRGYGLGSAALLLAFGAFARLSAGALDRTAIATAAVAAVCATQLLYFNAPLVFALGLATAIVGIGRRQPRMALVAVGIGTAAALSPLIWIRAILLRSSWSPLLRAPVDVGEIVSELARAASAPVGALRWVWVLVAALALFVALRPAPAQAVEGEPSSPAADESGARTFALWVLPLALAAQIAFQWLLQNALRPWYVLPVLCVVGLALDVLLSGSTFGRGIRIAVVAMTALALALPAFSLARTRMTNMDLAADRIAAGARTEDLVLLSPWQLGIGYQRYRHVTTPWMTVPEIEDHSIHRYDLIQQRMTEPDALKSVRLAVEQTLRSGHDVWLLTDATMTTPATPAPALPPAPQSATGWQDVPYLEGWSSQIEKFLRDHSEAARWVPLPRVAPLSGYETLELRAFHGWR